jgi:PPOX class probable F420-dependent enzyme
MPTEALPDDLAEIFARPNPAVIAIVRPDGQPVSVATWYRYEDGRVLVNMDAARRRLAYLRNDPRVSLTVLGESWYNHISIQGEVVEITDDTDLSGIDRLSQHYTGQPYPNRERPRVNAWIRIDRWHGWGDYQR